METSQHWELVVKEGDGDTSRLEVPGGWLYRSTVIKPTVDGWRVAVALCFVERKG
jgi:hypothetical protein